MLQTPRKRSSKRLSSRSARLAEYIALHPTNTSLYTEQSLTQETQNVNMNVVHRLFQSMSWHKEHIVTTVLLYGVCTLMCFVLILFGHWHFTIQTISIQDVSQTKDTIRDLEQFIGDSTLIWSRQQIQTAILDHNPHLESVSVEMRWPQTLHIIPRLATVVSYMQVNERLYIHLDPSAKVVKISFVKPDYPEIKFFQQLVHNDYKLAHQVPFADVQYACQIAHILKTHRSVDYRILILDTNQIQVQAGDVTFLLSNADTASQQLVRLEDMLNYLERTRDTPTSVDLRFERIIKQK